LATILAAVLFTVGWLILSRTLQRYGVTPEEVGATFPWLAVRAGVAAGILVVAVVGLSWPATKGNAEDIGAFVVVLLVAAAVPLFAILFATSSGGLAPVFITAVPGLLAGAIVVIGIYVLVMARDETDTYTWYDWTFAGLCLLLFLSWLSLWQEVHELRLWIMVVAGTALAIVTLFSEDGAKSTDKQPQADKVGTDGESEEPKKSHALVKHPRKPLISKVGLAVLIALVTLFMAAVGICRLPGLIQRSLEAGKPYKAPLGLLTFDLVRIEAEQGSCFMHLGDNGGVIVLLDPGSDRTRRVPADATELLGGCG
jgi:hypothetical protein